MKKTQQLSLAMLCITLSFSAHSEKFDQLLESANSQASATTAAPQAAANNLNALDMIPLLTNSLSVDKNQAVGGLGSLFGYAKEQLSSTESSQLSSALPGLDSLVDMAPKVGATSEQQSGIGGLLSTAAQYNDSLKGINQLNQQFQALGLKPEMISQFANTAMQYLNSAQGQQAGALLKQGLSAFL
ncbi:MAG: DUF2780 domain-containing protein [Porticoccaceae bacterium]|nr:DUF2780 domain-containing protein [Porticoccaceae bacterium]